MKEFVLFLLLAILSAIWSVRVDIRRSPPGDIIESGRPNVTLHCDLLESGPVESVIWYYQGEVLRQISEGKCHHHHQPALADFLHHELGSGLEGSSEGSEGSSGGEADGVLLEDELLSSGDYMDLETGGSGETPPHILCGVQPGQLSLHEVSRQFSGRYACAAVSGGVEGPRSEELELSVECKSDFVLFSFEWQNGRYNKASHLT